MHNDCQGSPITTRPSAATSQQQVEGCGERESLANGGCRNATKSLRFGTLLAMSARKTKVRSLSCYDSPSVALERHNHHDTHTIRGAGDKLTGKHVDENVGFGKKLSGNQQPTFLELGNASHKISTHRHGILPDSQTPTTETSRSIVKRHGKGHLRRETNITESCQWHGCLVCFAPKEDENGFLYFGRNQASAQFR